MGGWQLSFQIFVQAVEVCYSVDLCFIDLFGDGVAFVIDVFVQE